MLSVLSLVIQPPAADIDRRSAAVVEFDPLVVDISHTVAVPVGSGGRQKLVERNGRLDLAGRQCGLAEVEFIDRAARLDRDGVPVRGGAGHVHRLGVADRVLARREVEEAIPAAVVSQERASVVKNHQDAG